MSFHQIPLLLLDVASPFPLLATHGLSPDSSVADKDFTITQDGEYQDAPFCILLYLILSFNLTLHAYPSILTQHASSKYSRTHKVKSQIATHTVLRSNTTYSLYVSSQPRLYAAGGVVYNTD